MELYERIPNNVNLSEDKRLQRALEKWLPDYLNWWREMGPEGFQDKEVYLRTAVGVDADGWANFDFAKKPKRCWRAVAATPTSRASSKPSINPATTGSTSTASRCSQTATASINSR